MLARFSFAGVVGRFELLGMFGLANVIFDDVVLLLEVDVGQCYVGLGVEWQFVPDRLSHDHES